MQLRFTALVLASALLVPASAAQWAGKGHSEPSTELDRTGGWMWPGPDTARVVGNIGSRLYFNSITIQNTAYSTHGITLNPNFATLQSEKQGWPGEAAALLGVWKDCNKDGFIGFGDNALFEYRVELLNGDTSVCPPVGLPPIPSGAASHTWRSAHNDGTWVHEFIPLGPDARAPHLADQNPWDLNDRGVRVWADWNKPDDLPPGTKCYVVFAPSGSYSSTGGLLGYADCLDNYRVTKTWDAAVDAIGGDDLGLGQLSFKDSEEDPKSSQSQLNKPSPWGRPSDSAYVSTFDCSQPAAAGPVPVPGTQYSFRVSQPRVPTVTTSASLAGTVNETENAFEDCDRGDGGTFNVAGSPYSAESSGVRNYVLKVQNDFPMSYTEGFRPSPAGSRLGAGTPGDLGTRQYDSEGLWISGTRIAEDRNPWLDRADLLGAPFQRVQYVSAYAFVPATAVSTYGLSLNPSGNKAGVYGSENCPFIGTGASPSRGWVCDPSQWITDCSNGYQCAGTIDGQANVDISVKVGQLYNLRDIDCYDTSIGALRGVGVGWGVLTGTECK